MREILFRGKRVSNGKWVEGGYCRRNSQTGKRTEYYISECYTDTEYNVIPETIGQYTGLTDKNGVKIFEGDIIHCIGGEFYNGYHEVDENIVVKDITDGVYLGEVELLEVIGNIMDNSELLEGESE